MKPEPGLHRGVPMAEYLALDAVSASLLRSFRKSPLHARHYMTQPREDTAALMVGEAAHYAILEPEKFSERYSVPPDVDRRTKVGREDWQAWIDSHPKCVPLRLEEYQAAQAISDRVKAHTEASRFLYGEGANELTLAWADDLVLCKARPDRIAVVDKFTWLPDIKTCRDASPWAFAKAAWDYGYHNKAAWYLDGAAQLFGKAERRMVFIAVESAPPHAIALYELTDEAIAQGRQENAAALTAYRNAMATGYWPGYPNHVQYLDLPKFAQAVEV